MNNISDEELINLLSEDEENVKNIIYDRYKYIIDSTINKYHKIIKMFNVDEQELYAEASLGFSDGIYHYSSDKDASLKTFLILCVDRSVTKTIAKYTTTKAKVLNDTFSIDYEDNNGNEYIKDTLKASDSYEPLYNLTNMESLEEILNIIKDNLSEFEYEVFSFMIDGDDYQQIADKMNKTPKQIDNTIQRIKLKIKKIINK